MVSKENLPKRNLTRSGNLFWMHCKYKHKNKTKYTYIYIYIHYEERIKKLLEEIIRGNFTESLVLTKKRFLFVKFGRDVYLLVLQILYF